MGESICYIVTVLCTVDMTLLRCAVRAEGWIQYPMEPEERAAMHELLPLHVRSCGPIVDVQQIFEIVDVTGKEGE